MMKKIVHMMLTCLIGFSLLMTGCSQSTSGDGAKVEKSITLRLATWDDAEAAKNTQILIDEFEKENPNIKVQFEPTSDDYMTKLRTSIAAGNPADVMMVDEWPTLYSVQPFEPLDGYFESQDFDYSIYAPSVLKLWQHEGKQYGMPADINLTGFYYNKKLFDEAGLPYPDENWTWSDVENYAQQLTQGDGPEKTYGVFMQSNWTGAVEPMLWGNGSSLIDEDNNYKGVMNAQDTVEAVEWYTSFEKNGLSPKSATTKAMGGAAEMFKTGKIALMLGGHWNLQNFKSSEGFDIENIGTVGLPAGPGGVKPAVIFSAGWHISKESKHKEAAFKLLIKMSGKEAQKMKAEAGWSLPAIPSLLPELGFEDDPLRKPFIDMAYGEDYTIDRFSIYFSPIGNAIHEELSIALEKVILDKADAKTALDDAVKNIENMEK